MSAGAWGLVLGAQAFASCAMAGLIWFVQIVHYPLFSSVGEHGFARYAERHRARTTVVVAPLMLAELACAALVVLLPGAPVAGSLAWAGGALVLIVWGLTFFVAVPLHARLDRGYDAPAHRLLVATNWLRTLAWSGRAVLALTMLSGAARAPGS